MERSRKKLAALLPAAVTAAFKAKVTVDALKERQTLARLAEKFERRPNQISQWKKEFIVGSKQVFESGKGTPTSPPETGEVSEAEAKELYAKVGQLQMERDFKKTKPSETS